MIGTVTLEHRDPTGQLIGQETLNNLVVTVGRAHVAGILGGVITAQVKFIGIGTDNTAAAAGQTQLLGEIERLSAACSRTTTTTTDDTAVFIKTFTASSAQTVREAGLHVLSIGGTMLSRVVTSTHSMNIGDTLLVTWNIKIA